MAQKTLDEIRADAPAASLTDNDIFVVQQDTETKGGVMSQFRQYLFGGLTLPANTILAGPVSGGDDIPVFRELVLADMPNLSSVYQPVSIALSAVSALSPAANKIVSFSGASTAALLDFSTDVTLGSSDTSIPSQKAVRDFVANQIDALDFMEPGDVSLSGLTTSSEAILGRISESTGAIEKIPLGAGLAFSGGALVTTVTDIDVQDVPDDITSLDPEEDDIAVIVTKVNDMLTAYNALLAKLVTAGVLVVPETPEP